MTINIPRASGGQRVWVINPSGTPVPVSIEQDSTGAAFVFDADTGALKTIDVEHFELHDGDLFRIFHRQTGVGNGVDVNILFVTPNQDVDFHFEGSVSSSGGAYMQLYEDAVIAANGAQLAVYNALRRSPKTNIMTVYLGPTVTNPGTQLDGAQLGAGQNTGGISRGEGEWVFAQNKNYLLRITSAAAANIIAARLRWYELEIP